MSTDDTKGPKVPQGYSAAQMVSEAKKRGFGATQRLIADWASLGLLDEAEPEGRGRNKGVLWTRSSNQLELFLTLLQKKQEGLTRVGDLAKIPVFVWVYWPAGYVPVRQVAKALRTWAHRSQKVTHAQEKVASRTVVDQFADPDALKEDKDRLVALLASADGGPRGGYDDPSLKELLQRVIDPTGSGRAFGPEGAQANAEAMIALYSARLDARNRALRLQISGPELEDARLLCLVTRAHYQSAMSQEHMDLRWHRPFPKDTAELLLNGACLDLISCVGLNTERHVITRNQDAASAKDKESDTEA